MMIPRRKEETVGYVSLNSLGFVGTVVAKTLK